MLGGAMACLLLILIQVTTGEAKALYILTDSEDTAIVLDENAETAGFASKLVNLRTGSSGYEIVLRPDFPAVIHYGGRQLETVTRAETASALLSRMQIRPGPLEMVGVDLSMDRVTITVAPDLTFYERVRENVEYKTLRVDDATLPLGTEKVVQAGKNGERTAVYEVVYSSGQIVSRQFVEELESSAADEIIHVGTAVTSATSPEEYLSMQEPITNISTNPDGSGTLTLRSGETLEFSSVRDMTATAYTTGYDGVDTCTATGTFVHIGTVAVDKNVIPLGTRMYIVTKDGKIVYGLSVAEDTGVRGEKVDLYYDTYDQCIQFGRRACTVYILK